MKLRRMTLLIVACLLLPLQAFADSALSNRFSDSELVRIMKGEGYGAVKKIDDGSIRVKIDGRTYMLFNQDDGDLQAYYGIGGTSISYRDINSWNRTKRLSRAYLDSDRDPVLEADLLANGGLTVENVTEFFKVFVGSVEHFREFIIEHDDS
ncbi:YbjN domain-containing protein [Amphritea opalescens]|nr:YbjN domain-containing protein [Amphritea opalescens]